MRILREYRRMAHKEHFCYRCCGYITPGEEYEGRVMVDKNSLFVYKRTH